MFDRVLSVSLSCDFAFVYLLLMVNTISTLIQGLGNKFEQKHAW